jgi:hypothetical protein
VLHLEHLRPEGSRLWLSLPIGILKFIGTHAEYDRIDALSVSQYQRKWRTEIRPIRTDKGHKAALAEIEAYWGVPGGSEQGDRLDVLLALN